MGPPTHNKNPIPNNPINPRPPCFILLVNIYTEKTEQNYRTALSPIKDQYISSYNQAEEYSDFKEYSTLCIYFNHFVSMIDAFILARKFNGGLLLTSSTVYQGNSNNMPIGVNLKLLLSL